MEKESATKCKTEPKRGDKLEFGCIYVACVCLLCLKKKKNISASVGVFSPDAGFKDDNGSDCRPLAKLPANLGGGKL